MEIEKPIRILQVLTIMGRGGAESMIMNYYRNINRNQVQFDFLVHREEKGAFDDEIESLGGKIYRMPSINPKNYFNYKEKLNVFFTEHKEYKIVHSHLNALSIIVLSIAKKNDVPIRIAHSHTSLYNLNLNPFSKQRHSLYFAYKFILQNLLKRKVSTYASHYFSCGAKAGKWLFGKRNFKKVNIINNAIDSGMFTYNPEKSLKIKKELKLDQKIVLGHVGNFVPEKNHSFLIEVYQEIKKINNNTTLVLAGRVDKSQIQKLTDRPLPADIKFLGLRNDIPEILQAIDVFIFPSTNEGLPLSLIEAQASGLKIVASDSITKELDITNLLNYISLKQSPEYWANYILNELPYDRRNTKNEIIEGEYDIVRNALMLQEFYIKNYTDPK
ncbi:MAG: glycosyltransferase involved in cell wall biosynthesis [Polaribacter sp.]|jgi:glycosyltransferase involved in cell wall biosynthesis